jgi:hypothetical protein
MLLSWPMPWPGHMPPNRRRTSRSAETVAGVPILFGFIPLNEVGNLVPQVPTQLFRVNPERSRFSVDLPLWTVSVFGMPMPGNRGCLIHVDIKKSPSVQKIE